MEDLAVVGAAAHAARRVRAAAKSRNDASKLDVALALELMRRANGLELGADARERRGLGVWLALEAQARVDALGPHARVLLGARGNPPRLALGMLSDGLHDVAPLRLPQR